MESSQCHRIGAASEEGLRRQAEAKVWPVDNPRAELARELECSEGTWLDALLELGVTPDTAPAFEALPLVEVAWSDGSVDSEERWRVLGAATAFGLELGRPAHAQLELWLEHRPAQALFDAWHEFAAEALIGRRAAPRARRVIGAACGVAAAAGGIFGVCTISRPERAVVKRIRKTLGHREDGHEDCAGRFDRQVLVDRPDRPGRRTILDVHTKGIELSPNFDLDEVAALTPGFTGADLANLVNEATLVATRRHAQSVEMADFTAAIERIVAGLESPAPTPSTRSRSFRAGSEPSGTRCSDPPRIAT